MSIEESLASIVAEQREKIVERAVEKMASRLAKMVYPNVVKAFNKRTEKAIEDRVAAMLHGIESRELTATDSYGMPRPGEPKQTLVELCLKKAENYLNQSVNHRGETVSYHNSHKCTRIQWMAEQAASKLLNGTFEQCVKNANEELKKQLHGKLATAVAKALKECL